MYYFIEHVTSFEYSEAISESVMEVRKQPRSEGIQHCLRFDLQVQPKADVSLYRDYLSNTIHHFDVPAFHSKLKITAKALVEVTPIMDFPDTLDRGAWKALDEAVQDDKQFYDMLVPSHFARPTGLLDGLSKEIGASRRRDPLTLLRELNAGLYDALDYVPQSTRVDSPIDDALTNRRGVCQDFAHIMIGLVRGLGIPCRYVSGYLYRQRERSREGATHAWIEAWLPELGWVGFDPTNNVLCRERHIRAAVGRDYADVPPTRGVFKGDARTKLSVSVVVERLEKLPEDVAYSAQSAYSTQEIEVQEAEEQYIAHPPAPPQHAQQQQQ